MCRHRTEPSGRGLGLAALHPVGAWPSHSRPRTTARTHGARRRRLAHSASTGPTPGLGACRAAARRGLAEPLPSTYPGQNARRPARSTRRRLLPRSAGAVERSGILCFFLTCLYRGRPLLKFAALSNGFCLLFLLLFQFHQCRSTLWHSIRCPPGSLHVLHTLNLTTNQR